MPVAAVTAGILLHYAIKQYIDWLDSLIATETLQYDNLKQRVCQALLLLIVRRLIASSVCFS